MPSNEKSQGQKLSEQLTYSPSLIAKDSPDLIAATMNFCEGYKNFMSRAKIEREVVHYIQDNLELAGYTVFDPEKTYKPGDKVYINNRGKSVIATTFGQRPLTEGLRLNAAHIDSPRLDLKPMPLYEQNDIAYFKTHYYGGIRKYQWATIPLSLHGAICRKDGALVEVNVGDDPGDPVLFITDLLPHLAARQSERKLAEGIRGEELNILVGSLPYPDKEVKDPVKLAVLSLLHDKYGITEADFLRAELEVTVAGPARDVGFDRSMIAAAGQDDRVCAYTALMAEIECKNPTYTTVTVFTDKEEIGSIGNTGLHSDYLKLYLQYLAGNSGLDYKSILKNALCLSSDVSAAYDPTFADAYDPANSPYIGKGITLMKYTGARGKGGCSDASAETMYQVIDIMDRNHIYWQSGEIGKVDEGGGGTVAQYIADLGIDVVDAGVPVLAMHAPTEIVSKMDVYQAYKAYEAFYK